MPANYFGVVTCPNCRLKVSLSPGEVLLENRGHEFLCRNCRAVSRLPEGFMFKQTTGRDLTVEEALQYGLPRKGFTMPAWISRLFAKEP